MTVIKLSFKPKQLTKKLLSGLKDRSYDVVVGRFGLVEGEPMTLEAIGQQYGITRERVRQIEAAALASIRKSDSYQEEMTAFEELKEIIKSSGGVVNEDEILEMLSKDPVTKNHIYFFLVLGDQFEKHKEDENFAPRWSVDKETSDTVHNALDEIYKKIGDNELIPESEMISRFLAYVKDVNEEYRDQEVIKRWLNVSKNIGKNPLGEYGKSESPAVNCRGVKDYAYLVMRKHGSPLHFKEVAKAINEHFGKKTHVATCHNELIKDNRFVLVGRGMYALKEWGYETGVVRDVISRIIKKEGPLSKDDIIDRVLKERYLKKNTIVVNLQNNKYFKKNKQGLYTVA